MWRFVADLARSEAEVELKPTELLSDYEEGALNAFQIVFAGTVKGCRFHLHQNFVTKHIQKCPTLRSAYEQRDSEEGKQSKFSNTIKPLSVKFSFELLSHAFLCFFSRFVS